MRLIFISNRPLQLVFSSILNSTSSPDISMCYTTNSVKITSILYLDTSRTSPRSSCAVRSRNASNILSLRWEELIFSTPEPGERSLRWNHLIKPERYAPSGVQTRIDPHLLHSSSFIAPITFCSLRISSSMRDLGFE